jgi:hypothetical protein
VSGSTDELDLKARVDDPATLEAARAILEHVGYEVVMLGYFVAAYERRMGRPARIAAS